MGKLTTRALFTAFTVFLVGCDHATKAVAKEALGAGKILPLVGGWLDLRYTQNFDTAFSLTRSWAGASKPAWLTGITVIVMLTLGAVAYARRKRATRVETVGFALVLAGALGNAIDRLARGYVVDFIHLAHWPVFNVADVLVVVGALLLMWQTQTLTAAPSPSPPA
jgi:signal peptidase II